MAAVVSGRLSESPFSLTLALVFGAVGVLVLLVLVAVSQQQRYRNNSFAGTYTFVLPSL